MVLAVGALSVLWLVQSAIPFDGQPIELGELGAHRGNAPCEPRDHDRCHISFSG